MRAVAGEMDYRIVLVRVSYLSLSGSNNLHERQFMSATRFYIS